MGDDREGFFDQKLKQELLEQQMYENFVNPVLVLISNQLGIKQLAPQYFPVLNKLMNIQQFVGAVGGKPNLAFYFAGTMINRKPGCKISKKVIYLDPHQVKRKDANIAKEYQEAPRMYHCQS